MLLVKGAPGSKRFWREDCLSTAAQQIPIVNSVIPCVLHLSGMVLFLFLFLFLFMMTLFPLHNILWVKFLIPFILWSLHLVSPPLTRRNFGGNCLLTTIKPELIT